MTQGSAKVHAFVSYKKPRLLWNTASSLCYLKGGRRLPPATKVAGFCRLHSMNLKDTIRVVPDFPKQGISFKDITTLLRDAEALRHAVRLMADYARERKVDMVFGVESRGFILGAPLAYELGVGFALIRKPGKLPGEVLRVDYALEYGTDALEIHKDAVEPGARVLIVDDLLATGGTISAAAQLVNKLDAEIAGIAFLIELEFLKGRDRLQGYDILTLVQYQD